MGRQFVFWKQQRRGDGAPRALDVYRALMEGSTVEGLLPMPVAEILASLCADFPSALIGVAADSPRPVFWSSDDEQHSIEFDWSAVHFMVEFRPFGSSNHDDVNRIIDALAALECPLYDPQTGERFDGPYNT